LKLIFKMSNKNKNIEYVLFTRTFSPLIRINISQFHVKVISNLGLININISLHFILFFVNMELFFVKLFLCIVNSISNILHKLWDTSIFLLKVWKTKLCLSKRLQKLIFEVRALWSFNQWAFLFKDFRMIYLDNLYKRFYNWIHQKIK